MIIQKERKDYRQKNKRGDIEKLDQTDSLEIPDRGKTAEIPGLLSGKDKSNRVLTSSLSHVVV